MARLAVAARVRVIDTGGRGKAKWLRPFLVCYSSALAAWSSICKPDAVYVAVKAGNGMWLSSAVARVARLAGARIFLHHHSYRYVGKRKARMVALTRAAGREAVHIVLSNTMARDIQGTMPEIGRLVVLSNALWIDESLMEIPARPSGGPIVLGHLGNLSESKGIGEVVGLALALSRGGHPTKLILAGPCNSDAAQRYIDLAARELGIDFEYRGRLEGERKRSFFSDITHFVLPTRDDALPLVLYEAMAAGAICVTTRRGSIPEQLEGSDSIIVDEVDSFVDDVLPLLVGASSSESASMQSKSAFQRAVFESETQMASLIEILVGCPGETGGSEA